MTKASIRAKEAQSRETAEKVETLARQSRVEFEQRLIEFEQQRETKLEIDKAKSMGEFARLGPTAREKNADGARPRPPRAQKTTD